MSTVLRPVGPLEPRVYWVRRAVVLGVVLVVIIVLAVAFSGGSSKKPTAHHPGAHPSTSTSSTTSSPPTTAVSACDLSTLTLVLSTDTDTYTSGQAPTLVGVISNTSATTCTLADTPSQEVWTVKSGTAKIWTSKGCPSSDVAKQIKIKPGATKKLSTVWNGHVQQAGCSTGSVAQPGTYTLHATLDGLSANSAAVFHITS